MTGKRRTSALIVKNDRRESELAALMFGEFGLEVSQVASAGDALAFLCDRGEDVGVVLIDVQLDGGMDGIALARRICVLWPTLSVLVTTGDVAPVESDLPARVVFVRKPWRPLDIVAAAEKAARADHSLASFRL